MITIKNSGTQTMTWYALPKYTSDIKQAIASGTVAGGGQTTYPATTTVNILYAFPGNEVAALAIVGQDATVTYEQQSFGTWCVVS